VSLGWVVSRENFFPENSVIDFLKIRGSYGVVGNDRIGNFRYISTVLPGRNYTFGYDNYVIGYSPSAPANPDLQWEETTQTNIGFEATLFETLSVVFDIYSKNTTGMLMDVKIPDYVGAAGNPVGNVAAMTNKGVELELGYRKQIGGLYVDVKANGSYLKNEVTDIGQFEFLESGSFQSSQYSVLRTEVGQSFNSFYGYEILGIFQNTGDVNSYSFEDDNGISQKIQPNAKPGDFKFADLDGDGKITESDRTFIGNQIPTWTYGLTASANYMGFDIMLFCQGVAGNKVYNAMRRLDIANANWTSDALGRWTGEGTSDSYPRLTQSDPNKNFSLPSDFFLTSGTYFRIKTLQIGYTLPKAILEKVGIEQLRFYLSSNNLATFTKYNGFDPEIGGSSYGIDRGVYPQARSFLFGINLTL
jgi:TonB-linked SusC/RagA family outer membrane protein